MEGAPSWRARIRATHQMRLAQEEGKG